MRNAPREFRQPASVTFTARDRGNLKTRDHLSRWEQNWTPSRSIFFLNFFPTNVLSNVYKAFVQDGTRKYKNTIEIGNINFSEGVMSLVFYLYSSWKIELSLVIEKYFSA